LGPAQWCELNPPWLSWDLAQTNWSEVDPTNLGQYRPKIGLGRFRPNKLYSLFFPISFFSFPLLLSIFSHSFFFFCSRHPPFFSPSSPRGRGARATLPLSGHGDGVGWLGRPLCNHPRVACRACLPCPFIMVVDHEWVWVMSGFLE